MPRTPSPRYWRARRVWHCIFEGRRHILARGPEAETKAAALAAFHRLMAAEGKAPPDSLTVRDLANLFLLWTRDNRSELTFGTYRRHLRTFVARFGHRPAVELRPPLVDRWLEGHPGWGTTTRHGAITAVKRLSRWAYLRGHLQADQLAGVEKPRPLAREAIVSPDQAQAILRDAERDPAWHALVRALFLTGARPGELARAEASGLDRAAGVLWVSNKTAGATGARRRAIPLSEEALDLVAGLAAARPSGPIFLNARGRPWTRNAMACRFARLRRKFGWGGEATAAAFRHRFVSDGLEGGVPIATVAALVGHRGTAMVTRVYSKLADAHAHLRRAAGAIRPPQAKKSGGTVAEARHAGVAGPAEAPDFAAGIRQDSR